ncbi:MAG TPA: hypothetical protein VGS41_14190 [Chthonomonadales bacterium]|nr:hypothetical protein [Chthonomonadales bacterium]
MHFQSQAAGTCVHAYEQDYDETTVPPSEFHFISQNPDGSFTGSSPLEPYIKNHPSESRGTVWVCPDLGKYYQGPSSWGNYLCTYSMNVFLTPPNGYDPDPDACYTPASQETSVSWNGFPGSYSNESNLDYHNYPANGSTLARIYAPADTVLIYEAYVEDGNPATDPYVGLSGEDGDYLQLQGFWTNQTDANNSWGYPLQPATVPWHKSVNNYVFNDGHVKARPVEQEGWDITQHPQDNIWLTNDGRSGGSIPAPPSGGC